MKIELGFLEDEDGDALPILEVDGELVEPPPEAIGGDEPCETPSTTD